MIRTREDSAQRVSGDMHGLIVQRAKELRSPPAPGSVQDEVTTRQVGTSQSPSLRALCCAHICECDVGSPNCGRFYKGLRHFDYTENDRMARMTIG